MMNALAVAAALTILAGSGHPVPPVTGGLTPIARGSGGVDTHAFSRSSGSRLKKAPKVKPGVEGKAVSVAVSYQYRYVVACYGNGVEDGDNYCEGAFIACAAQFAGPLTTVWRREVTVGSVPGPWVQVGSTCFPDSLPGGGAAPRPVLTYAMVRDEWARTVFATSGVSMQPPGGRTLVTLPVFVQIVWPAVGYAPGEVRSVTLLGHRVQIKPTLVSFRYSWGDGSAVTVSRSSGGRYPSGDVHHRYDRAGRVGVRADTVYGGQFSVDGGDWVTIDGSVTVAGSTQPLSVLTARNRLTVG